MADKLLESRNLDLFFVSPRLAIGSVLFAVLLGFAQEYRAERASEALRQMAAPTAKCSQFLRAISVDPSAPVKIGTRILTFLSQP